MRKKYHKLDGTFPKDLELEKSEAGRKNAEERLIQYTEQMRLILESIGDGIYGVDLKGNTTFVNQAMCRMTGHEPDEFIGKHQHEILHHTKADGTHYPSEECLIYKTLEDGVVRNYADEVFWKKDGTSFPVEYICTPMREGGMITGAVVVFKDITERKQSEETLFQAEERYRSLFEDAQEGIYQTLPEGRFILANPALARMLGYKSPEELITSITDIKNQLYVERNAREKLLSLLARDGKLHSFETQYYRKDGSKIWVSISMREVRDKDGHLLHYEGINEDITARKQAEEKLKGTLEKLRKVLNGTIQAMASTVEARDPYTAGHQRRVSNLGRAIAQEMGLSVDIVDGIRIAGIIHDIGKIAVPAEILSKPAKLTKMEFELVKLHPQAGYDILKEIDFPRPIAQIILQHHERMDGSGYPHGLSGDKIMIEAKILAVADVIESMATHRPYRPAYSIDKALEEISQNKGILYDAEVVDACLRLFKEKGATLDVMHVKKQ